jgi:hypothetical protein
VLLEIATESEVMKATAALLFAPVGLLLNTQNLQFEKIKTPLNKSSGVYNLFK